jgi:asparagine synthase (glutamine-hydrolysing)
MHLFAAVVDVPDLDRAKVEGALQGAAEGLDPDTVWWAASTHQRVLATGIHHGPHQAGPRRYLARSEDSVTLFDGLPVATDSGLRAIDAAELERAWEGLGERLDGQFCAVRVDLRAETVEILADTLGFVPVYYARRGDGYVISNSALAVGALLGLGSPDPLGVSTFLGLGWTASDRTTVDGVHILCGGSLHRIGAGRHDTERRFGPAQLASRKRRREAPAIDELADSLVELTHNATEGIERVGCALTGGRDSRVLLALLLAANRDALYFTGGVEEVPDVIIARELAAKMGLRHEVVRHDPEDADLDWTDAAMRFMRQNDGQTSLLQIGDYVQPLASDQTLGVKLGGMGGEIGRAGTGDLTAFATNAPLLRRSLTVQHKLLAMKASNDGGLMTDAARAEVHRYLRRFYDERLEEGWRRVELQEAFYIFERMGRWATTTTRRVATTDDAFSPLLARPFLDYCLSLSSAERYLEAAHFRLMGRLSRELREHRYERPFQPQMPAMARLLVTRRLARALATRLAARLPSRGGEESTYTEYRFPQAWFEARLELMRELFDQPSSELWELVSRARVQQLLNGGPAGRAQNQEALMRVTTLFWHFHSHQVPALAALPSAP